MSVFQVPKHLHPDFALPNKKPVGGVEVDRNHWLGKHALCAIVPQNAMIDLVKGSLDVNSDGALVEDRLFKTVGNTADYAEYRGALPQLTECTLIFRGRMNVEGGGVFGDKTNANWSTNGVSFLRWADARRAFWKINNSEVIPASGWAGLGSATEVYDIACTWKAGVFQRIYSNSVEATYSASAVAASHTVSTQPLRIGSGYTLDSAWSLNAEYEYMYFFDRALSQAEIQAFHRDPYQVLKPKTPQFYFTADAVGAAVLSADSGAYTYSGTAATLAAGKILTADSGSYAYTGTAAALSQGFSLAAASGAYTYSGTDAALTKDMLLTATTGSYSYSGTDAGIQAGFALGVDSGSYAYTGTAATLTFTPASAFTLTADSGSYSYSGTSASLLFGASLTADSGAYAYTGTAAALTFASAGNFTLTADNGAYSYSGTIAALTADRVLVGSSGGYAYSGTAAALSKGFNLAVDSGAYSYSGTNIDFSVNSVLDAVSGSYVYNGTNVSLLYTPIGPDIPIAEGLAVSGTFGNGMAVTSSFGNGIAVKGKL